MEARRRGQHRDLSARQRRRREGSARDRAGYDAGPTWRQGPALHPSAASFPLRPAPPPPPAPGHVDMVCEKNAEVAHDFMADPIKLVGQGGGG